MRIVGKMRWFDFLWACCVLSVLAGVPTVGVAAEHARERDAAYLDQIVGVLRSHVIAMRMILDEEGLKYADNMVRHAEAFSRTFGMVGPMEWHAAEAFNYMQKGDAAEKLTEAQFEQLAEESHQAIERLQRAARRYERDKDKQRMRDSINDVIKSCGACHSKLPEGTVPAVWKGLKE